MSIAIDDAATITVDVINGMISVRKRFLAPEDAIAIRFAEALEALGIRYAYVAGYIAILFGRNRRSDDVDVLADVDEVTFVELCKEARRRGFELMQGDIESESSVKAVYQNYLREGLGVRFVLSNTAIPSIEFKKPATRIHRIAIDRSVVVVINGRHQLRISPIELQIAYKLKLGSDKDIGDAVYLATIFGRRMDINELCKWCKILGVDCGIVGVIC
ncbi:MAG: hypothetical protein GXO32_02385 [Crenarchaeota archaeon]|nr:hypothetical protein [Thermoproteota archaeon]